MAKYVFFLLIVLLIFNTSSTASLINIKPNNEMIPANEIFKTTSAERHFMDKYLKLRTYDAITVDDKLYAVDYTNNRLLELNNRNLTVTRCVSVGSSPYLINYLFGYLWVTNYADATISKIRIFDFAVVATIPAGSGPQRAIASTNYVWVANTNANTVTRINPVTDAYSDIALTGGTHTPDKIVYLNNHVWVKSRNSLGKLEKINCSTGASAGVYDFESVLGGIIAYESYLYLTWNATSGSRTYFSKVDPADGSIISSVEIDYNSYGYFLYGKRICNVSNEMWVLNNNSHELEIIDLLSFICNR